MPVRAAVLTLIAAILPLIPGKALASCPMPISNRELSQDMTRAEKAYSSLDLDGFNTATDAMRTDLPCAGEPITKDIAARLHRVEGLRGYVDQDRRSATQSFAAARVLEPEYRFPESLVPAGYPELEMYDAIDVTLGTKSKVDPMIDGYLLFDGRVGAERSNDWPTVVQVVNEEGDVVVTAYLRPGQPMPNYFPGAAATSTAAKSAPDPKAFKSSNVEDDPFADVLDEDKGSMPRGEGADDDDLPEAGPTTPPPKSTASKSTATKPPESKSAAKPTYSSSATLAPKATTPPAKSTTPVRTSGRDPGLDDGRLDNKPKKKPTGLLVVSLVSAAASGGSYALAMHAANTYRDETTSLEELDALRVQANLWSGLSAGIGVVALGTGIAVGVRW